MPEPHRIVKRWAAIVIWKKFFLKSPAEKSLLHFLMLMESGIGSPAKYAQAECFVEAISRVALSMPIKALFHEATRRQELPRMFVQTSPLKRAELDRMLTQLRHIV